VICQRCNWFFPGDCTCPRDPETIRQQWIEVEARHRAAVELAVQHERWRRMRADRAERRAA